MIIDDPNITIGHLLTMSFAPNENENENLINVERLQLKDMPDYSKNLINFAKKFKFHTTEIAAATGKEHFNVTRDFVRLCEILEFDPHRFKESYTFYNNRGNRVQANGYSLPVELYVTLVTGYAVTVRAACIRLWEKKEKAYFSRIPREDAMNLLRELGFPLYIYPTPTDGKHRVNWEATFDLSKMMLATLRHTDVPIALRDGWLARGARGRPRIFRSHHALNI